jgi:nitrogen fixation NifU-like protein
MPKERGDLLRDLGYSEKAIEFINEERNWGRLPNFSTSTSHQGECGDLMRLYLDVDDGRIRDAGFEHVGCAGLQASASAITTMVKGMTVEEARRLDVEDIIGFLGTLPANKRDCAELARDTLRQALDELAATS